MTLFDVPAPRTAPRAPRVTDDDPAPPSPPVPPFHHIKTSTEHATTHPALTDGPRDGATYDDAQDADRLNGQCRAVLRAMADHGWHTLGWLAAEAGAPQASVSARLRDLRKPRFGGRVVHRRRVPGGAGLHEYRLDPEARTPGTAAARQHAMTLTVRLPAGAPVALPALVCGCGWQTVLAGAHTLASASRVADKHLRTGHQPEQHRYAEVDGGWRRVENTPPL